MSKYYEYYGLPTEEIPIPLKVELIKAAYTVLYYAQDVFESFHSDLYRTSNNAGKYPYLHGSGSLRGDHENADAQFFINYVEASEEVEESEKAKLRSALELLTANKIPIEIRILYFWFKEAVVTLSGPCEQVPVSITDWFMSNSEKYKVIAKHFPNNFFKGLHGLPERILRTFFFLDVKWEEELATQKPCFGPGGNGHLYMKSVFCRPLSNIPRPLRAEIINHYGSLLKHLVPTHFVPELIPDDYTMEITNIPIPHRRNLIEAVQNVLYYVWEVMVSFGHEDKSELTGKYPLPEGCEKFSFKLNTDAQFFLEYVEASEKVSADEKERLRTSLKLLSESDIPSTVAVLWLWFREAVVTLTGPLEDGESIPYALTSWFTQNPDKYKEIAKHFPNGFFEHQRGMDLLFGNYFLISDRQHARDVHRQNHIRTGEPSRPQYWAQYYIFVYGNEAIGKKLLIRNSDIPKDKVLRLLFDGGHLPYRAVESVHYEFV